MAEEEVKTESTETVEEEIIKPDYVSEKFWNKDTKEINVEDLSASYNSLEKKLGSRTDELSKQIREDIEKERLGRVPEAYEVKTPEVPEGITFSTSHLQV